MLRGGFERPNDAEEEMHFQQQDVLQARKQIRSQTVIGFLRVPGGDSPNLP